MGGIAPKRPGGLRPHSDGELGGHHRDWRHQIIHRPLETYSCQTGLITKEQLFSLNGRGIDGASRYRLCGNRCGRSKLFRRSAKLENAAENPRRKNREWDEFFLNLNQTALQENELLAEIKVPIPPAETASCFLKIGRTVIDIAIVNMSARMTMDGKGILTDVRIAFGAVAPTPLRIKTAEKMLLGADASRIENALIGEVSNKVAEEIKPITDVRGTAEYRREISRVLTKRAIENIIQVLQRRLKV